MNFSLALALGGNPPCLSNCLPDCEAVDYTIASTEVNSNLTRDGDRKISWELSGIGINSILDSKSESDKTNYKNLFHYPFLYPTYFTMFLDESEFGKFGL